MLVLILSILLIISASFSLNTYVRLKNASKSYSTPEAFENDSHMSIEYVQGGIILMIVVLIFGLGIGLSTFLEISK